MKNNIKKDISNVSKELIKSDFSAIQDKLDNNKGVILRMENKKKKINLKKYILIPTTLVATAAFAIFMIPDKTVVTDVTFDVNPSIEFGLDKSGKVREVIAMNMDANEIVKDINVEGKTVEEATKQVTNEMIKDNYISTEQNSVLVTTNGENAAEVLNKVNNSVTEELTNNNIEPSIITQVLTKTKELEQLAKEHNISVGKVELINKIIASNPTYTFDNLKGLTTNDLNLLANSKKNNPENIEVNGTPSTSNYITSDDALSIALTNANISNPTEVDIEIDMDNNILVYEVEFKSNNIEYEYDINAITGVVIKSEIDDNNDYDSNDDNDDNYNDDYYDYDDDDYEDDDNDNDDDDDDNDDDNDIDD